MPKTAVRSRFCPVTCRADMARRAVFAIVALVLACVGPAQAQQSDQTLADIRQELNILFVEVQRLKRELSTTGSPNVQLGGSTVLDRVAAIEAELQRLTAQTEQLQNRVNRVVTDGTNRIGDLEFRLVELEGGDVSQLGETTTLGGDTGAPQPPASGAETDTGQEGTQLAVGEESDFNRAVQALSEGNYQAAAEQFASFNQTYPGSPLAQAAEFNRGKAFDGMGNTREAARAYLAAFSADSEGTKAPEALFELGAALGRLGQTEQACITLGEVGVRFPTSEAVTSANEEMTQLSCS